MSNIFDEELQFDIILPTPTEGNAVAKEWMYFKNITRDQLDAVPFRMVQSATMQYGRVNEVMMLGWNMGDGGGPHIAGLPWLGQSFESNFAGPNGDRMLEFHMITGFPGGPQIRTFSDTINTVQHTIDRYMTVDRLYLKLPNSPQPDGSGDRIWAMFQPSTKGAEFNLRSTPEKAFKFIFSDDYGVDLNLASNQAVRKFGLNGFLEWSFPGLSYGNSELRIASGMKFLPDLASTVDIGSMYYKFKTVFAETLGTNASPIGILYTDLLTYGRRTTIAGNPWIKTTSNTPQIVYARQLDDKGAGMIEISLMGVNSDGTGSITGKKAIQWQKTVGGIASAEPSVDIISDKVKPSIAGASWRLFMRHPEICVEITGIDADMFWYIDIKYSSIQPF